jgi:hypothetical protein
MTLLILSGFCSTATGQLLPNDTIRYTTDGTIPDRSSPFVTYGSATVHVDTTTIFTARLYRLGYDLPSIVQRETVYVASGFSSMTFRVLEPYGMDSLYWRQMVTLLDSIVRLNSRDRKVIVVPFDRKERY